ncbi:MAG TPA: pilus assembly protein PilM [Syntrophomonadaceae bacterium]|nr:pilus assembly protein PilM [Syntrophomonadaceae bacterium]
MNDIFALDIGTREVVGLVMQKKEDEYIVLDSEVLEHKTRAMIDGQIHDVEAVAKTIREIKAVLEKRLNIKIEKGAVAAAGRALKTSTASLVRKRLTLDEISYEEVLALEVEAVQIAQFELAAEDGRGTSGNDYFCVGYSVSSYLLNDQQLGSLVGQTGATAGVNVIATFLPRVVVDSLFSSLKRADLDIYSLTLEPIAALSVAIPPNMRVLNLALVDIGAGTSDIAIVKNGNIYAYAMVSMGGDKLTEFIANQYLLDFDNAESLKRQIGKTEVIEFTDILGNKNVVGSEDIIEELQPIINDLVSDIAQNILRLNEVNPDAVILIGGGSLSPELPSILAEHLNLPSNRVGLRNPESMNELVINSDFLKGPQGVTPLGIGYNSFISKPLPFIKVKVNSREIVLWNAGKITVAQALLSSGISLSNIYGKPGLGKTIQVNGEIKSYKGVMGELPIIKVNNKDSSLDDIIYEEDVIEFERGRDGKDAKILVEDLLSNSLGGYVYVNDEKLKLDIIVFINGKRAKLDEEIPDRAKVEFNLVNNIKNILLFHGIPRVYLQKHEFNFYLNGEKTTFKWSPITVMIEDEIVGLDKEVNLNDQIYYTYQNLKPKIKDVLYKQNDMYIKVEVNGEIVDLEITNPQVICAGQIVSVDEELQDNMRLEFDNQSCSAILSDIFKVINIKPSSTKRLKIIVDGENAGFTTPIFNDSKIELIWN